MAGMGGFAAWCLTILFSVSINAVAPVRIPLWLTTILALFLITYCFTFSRFGEARINRLLRGTRKIAGFAEDPNFPVDDPRRKLSRQFYSLRQAKKWLNELEARGATNFFLRDVRTEDEPNGATLKPASYTSPRLELTLAYVLLVIIIALVVQLFIETAFPDKTLTASDARREVHRQFPFWASMILTWVWLAHAELRKGV